MKDQQCVAKRRRTGCPIHDEHDLLGPSAAPPSRSNKADNAVSAHTHRTALPDEYGPLPWNALTDPGLSWTTRVACFRIAGIGQSRPTSRGGVTRSNRIGHRAGISTGSQPSGCSHYPPCGPTRDRRPSPSQHAACQAVRARKPNRRRPGPQSACNSAVWDSLGDKKLETSRLPKQPQELRSQLRRPRSRHQVLNIHERRTEEVPGRIRH